MNHRTLCPACRHPMAKLKFFDGTSSADAPNFDRVERQDFSGGGWSLALALWPFLWEIACDAARGLKSALRKRRARKLRDEIIPQFPNALICPLCHEIVRKS